MKKTTVLAAVCMIALAACSNADKQESTSVDKTTATEAANVSTNNASAVDAKFETMLKLYLKMKDAFVQSNRNEVAKAADLLSAELKNVSLEEASNVAMNIASATDISAMRVLFSELSDILVEAVKAQNISVGQLYLAYCPMANDDSGAYWITAENEIMNPYFGDSMLKCGEIKGSLN